MEDPVALSFADLMLALTRTSASVRGVLRMNGRRAMSRRWRKAWH